MPLDIVTVLVTQQVGPTPSNLQRSGAFISQGATTMPVGSLTLMTELADLTPILKGALALTSLTWAGSLVTATTAAPHGFTLADTILLTIAGETPAGYNGTYTATVTGTSTFTYPLVSNPGVQTVAGVYTPEDAAELHAMATTFFAQGSSVSVYVLELGADSATDGAVALGTWIGNNPETIYSFLVPRYWDANAAFLTLIQSYENTTAKTYFWVTTTAATYTAYSVLMKCVNAMIEAPAVVPGSEFSQAAAFWKSLSYDPSSTNKVTPFGRSFVFGVTPYPTAGNRSLLTTWKAANISVIGTGAEGGISNTIIDWGNMLDGRPFNYWYSVDWMQININLMISNAVINGSNDPLNPLYLDQFGITALEGVGANVLITAITVGLALGQVVQTGLDGTAYAAALAKGTFAGKAAINAVPFADYYKINIGDYKIGKYAGFSICYTPQRGFDHIVFNIVVSDFVAA